MSEYREAQAKLSKAQKSALDAEYNSYKNAGTSKFTSKITGLEYAVPDAVKTKQATYPTSILGQLLKGNNSSSIQMSDPRKISLAADNTKVFSKVPKSNQSPKLSAIEKIIVNSNAAFAKANPGVGNLGRFAKENPTMKATTDGAGGLTKSLYTDPYSRSDLELTPEEVKNNQAFANSISQYGYLPKGLDTVKSVKSGVKTLIKRYGEFNKDYKDTTNTKAGKPSKNTELDLNNPSNRRRYDATQLYFGLPQKTFTQAEKGLKTKSDYPSFSYADKSLEKDYKKLVLSHGFFSKFKEAEKQGKNTYSETTHDTNGVANAHSMGLSRDESGKLYGYYYDKWDLAVNPADLISEKLGKVFGGTSAIQSAISSAQSLITNGKIPKGKPFNVYGRFPITKQDSIKYAKTAYKKLPDDQNTWK